MTRFFRALILLFIAARIQAQSDSVAYRPEAGMPDGVYLTYQDFRHNRAVSKEHIRSERDKNQLDFISKVLAEPTLSFTRNDSLLSVSTQSLWGYFQNNALYVFFKGEFYRVPVFGSISYLVANVLVPGAMFYDGRFGSSASTTRTEIREFLLDFYSGEISDFNNTEFERLLSRDPALLQEYNNLPRRRRQESQYAFIRKYNQRHGVYFLAK